MKRKLILIKNILNNYIDDFNKVKNIFKGKNVIMICPGKTSETHYNKLASLNLEDYVLVSINFEYKLHPVDYLFVGNSRRMKEIRKDLYKKANNIENEIDGIEATEEQINNNIKVTRVKIMNEQGERALGKVKGNYVTIDMKNMKYMGEEEVQKASEILCEELKKMIDEYVNKEQEILVVGLGNIYVTPDALGPKVINEIDITRHLLKYVPQYLDKNTRPVSAISPGVLGTTGMETAEILKGIVDNVKPKLVIVIDSLASRSMERISSTIQLADTGIVPGAGVDNARKELTVNTLGVPVIALGIPTVVETAVVVNDCLDVFIEKLQEKAESNEYLNKLKEEDNYLEIKEALIPKNFNFIVTPKEIDSLVENMKDVVARGINMSL